LFICKLELKKMSKFNEIRPYYDSEVNGVLKASLQHPIMKAMMGFTFPDMDESVWQEQLSRTHSIRDFQINFVYKSIQKVLENTSEGFTTSGFENLEPNTSYLFISNHRDIILDTSLLNVSLHDHGMVMTASAIGDNLVQKDFLSKLSKLNRNFLVKRGVSPRELLQSSKLLSEYILQMLSKENRSVWVAQREGRTKDGNDATHPGVLKMIAMANNTDSVTDYFKNLKVVPVSISYEYDPTDALKMPQLLAQSNDQTYIKEKNEDFINLISGITGQKKRIHLHVAKPLNEELDAIAALESNPNKQIQNIAQVLDDAILQNYKLWPTNYIAYDILHKTERFKTEYTVQEKQLFIRRLELRIDMDNAEMQNGILAMYANPVVNKLKYSHVSQ
jgi:1-acyl-sn-glycerol-3-phosphate acyltransferase